MGRRDRGEGGRTLERDIRLREKEGTERQTEGGAAEFKQEGGGESKRWRERSLAERRTEERRRRRRVLNPFTDSFVE